MREYNVGDRRGLPKGVYSCRQRYIAYVWEEGGSITWQKTFPTPEEAEYRRLVQKQGHHWINMPDDPERAWGFVYLITNKKTGKMYVGKKQFRLWAGPHGGYKCTNPMDPVFFDEKAWKPNDWQLYTGSCNPLNAEIAAGNVWDYTYEVLCLAADKLSLHLAEVDEMLKRDVLEALDEDGQYLYYNENIASMEFRPPFLKAEVLSMAEKSADHMRHYYLKPTKCDKCGAILPYPGNWKCICKKAEVPVCS